MNKRRFNMLRRQKGIDYEFSQRRSGDPDGIAQLCPTTRKYNDYKETCSMIKMAAINDDEAAIMCILNNETSDDSVQKLLSIRDERGQPCIFYALQSRSMKAMVCLLDHSKITDCVLGANGESLLHAAARLGCIDLVRMLLVREILITLVDHVEKENGQAPLHIAAKYNHVEVAKEFLLHGAKIDQQDLAGSTPIFTAASKGYAKLLNVFLQHAGSRSVESLMLDSLLYGHKYESLFQVAVDSGDERTVQVCLDQNPNVVRKCLREEIEHGKGTLIHSACKNGMEQCFFKLVEAMDDTETMQLNRKDNLGFAPIHKAAINNHVPLVKYLCSISKSFVNQTTGNSQTALVLAAYKGHVNVVEELLSLDADFKISDDSNRTVLHNGIKFPKILRTLLKRKDIAQFLLHAKEKDGYMAVHTAALKGLYESLVTLMEFGANMNAFTNTSRSPLHCAVNSQRIDVVRLVLFHEESLVNKADAAGKTPLHTAAYYGSAHVVKCLLDHGAMIIGDGNINSPLHIAALKGHLAVVEVLIEFDRNTIDQKNKYGRTPLIVATSTGKTEVVKFLLENGASITEDYALLNCLDWCLIKNYKDTAMVMMLDTRWNKILTTTRHGSEGTMAQLVRKFPEVANRVLSNSLTTRGHPDIQEHVKRYDFFCLQDSTQVKRMTAIEAMVKTKCYICLCHPVCRKFLKAKWMDFGWKVHVLSLFLYLIFLIALNIYAFQIPAYQYTQNNPDLDHDASFNVKGSMVVCIIFASVNALKEIMQLIFYRHRYFFDPVNYMEWVLYVCVFIFTTPTDQKITVKTSFQWKACSIALLLGWINLVLYLRRFASYGIYVLMMRKIGTTLIKVLSLLILFFLAFAAAFMPIMNDKPGFSNFGLSMLSSAVMTMGEFDFKETFLDEANHDYETFYWLRLSLLIAFLTIMPVILMNLLLALAIGDTNSIMKQAKLNKHIQTAKILIDLERKRYAMLWCSRSRMVPALEELPNKRVHISRQMWEYLCYGPDFTSDEDKNRKRDKAKTNENVEERLDTIVDIMKEMHEQIVAIQQKLNEKESDKKKAHQLTRTRRNDWIESGGRMVSSEESSIPYQAKVAISVLAGTSRKLDQGGENDSLRMDSGEDFFPKEQDVEDDENREKKENDPEFIELRELHTKTPTEDYTFFDDDGDDDDDQEGRHIFA